MRLVSLVATLGIATLSLASVAGCSADTAEDPAADPAKEDELKAAAVITEKDNGKTIAVESGKSFTIALTDISASTGFVWKVKSVDRSLGSPKETVSPGDVHRPGNAGLKKFTWSTKSPLSLVGKHNIVLENARSFDAKGATLFSVTIDVKDGAAPGGALCGGIAGLTCGANEFCKYAATASCGKFDQSGKCTAKAQFCTAEIQKVCGCNGKTFNNACEAERAGVSVAASGPCAN